MKGEIIVRRRRRSAAVRYWTVTAARMRYSRCEAGRSPPFWWAPFPPDPDGVFMKKPFAAFSLALAAVASVAALAFAQSTAPSDAETVAAITQLENDAVKADLAQNSSFYDRYLADDWTGGTSRGTWDSKQSLVADMKDTKNNKTNSESIRDVKVHVYGDTAIASYTSTYDSMIK